MIPHLPIPQGNLVPAIDTDTKLLAFRPSITVAASLGDGVPKVVPKVFVKSRLTYTPCYCEENIYCMVRDNIDMADRKEYTVVFLSNQEKYCPLFYQKAAQHPQIPVCWDYHVILIHKPAATMSPSSTVYDFDTALDPFGLPFEIYFSKTLFGDEGLWNEPDPDICQETALSFVARHPRLFKLIPAEDYLRLFASTRKHMMKKQSIHKTSPGKEGLDINRVETNIEQWENEWLAKPPNYPPIRTEGSDNTLEKFLDFSWQTNDEYGKIVNGQEFWEEFTGTTKKMYRSNYKPHN